MEADHTTAATPHDPNEGFLRLWTHHEPELRAFVHACLPRAAEVDEVMQAVSLVAWRKFSTPTEPAQFAARRGARIHDETDRRRQSRARETGSRESLVARHRLAFLDRHLHPRRPDARGGEVDHCFLSATNLTLHGTKGPRVDFNHVERVHAALQNCGRALAAHPVTLDPAMGGSDVTQRRKDAKGCAFVFTHPVGECLLVGICFFFAPWRLCVTSHRRF